MAYTDNVRMKVGSVFTLPGDNDEKVVIYIAAKLRPVEGRLRRRVSIAYISMEDLKARKENPLVKFVQVTPLAPNDDIPYLPTKHINWIRKINIDKTERTTYHESAATDTPEESTETASE